jgi:hypothetical protein
MKEGVPKPGMASGWRKVSEGKYEFTLDPVAEVSKGKKLTPEVVKTSLESKLVKTHGVKVEVKSPSKVHVAFTGDEAAFLERVAKTKIQTVSKDVSLALESGGSDAGIRAKTADRAPAEGEVKAIIVSVAGKKAQVRIVAINNQSVKGKLEIGKKLTIDFPGKDLAKRGETIFFKPVQENDGIWQVDGISK